MNKVAADLYDRVMRGVELAGLGQWRADLLGTLEGDVIEVGAGTGRNLDRYPSTVTRLVVCEPNRHMRAHLDHALATHPCAAGSVEVVDAPAEHLPFPDASFDVAVSTLVLCSVDDPATALAELRRVLRPGGRLVFIEHVAAEDRPRRLTWQRRLEPLWKRLAGNCHLTRRTEDAIVAAGFEVDDVERASMRKAPPFVRPTVRGTAHRPDVVAGAGAGS